MCGIAGILTAAGQPPVAIEQLRDMAAVLRHRGPDGFGLYRDRRAGLAHTRLSIVDLAGGWQPIHNEDETIWITFNGEIFNYIELRQELEAAGHAFYTTCDTEVIVHAYEQWGAGAWARFNGQFAFGIWDSRNRRLWLVRDRIGILPLFFAQTPAGVVFASEVKAIFASGRMTPRIDPEALGQVFTAWSVIPPRTAFAGVECVMPGTAVEIDGDLRVRQTRYWQPEFATDGRDGRSDDATAAQLGEHLADAIRLRLRADVPVGAYLSGGLDSSVICRLIRDSRQSPLETFAVRFADPAFDETSAQRRMAEVLGTAHHETVCDSASLRETLPELIWHAECPLLRTAPAPLFLLSALVRAKGMKVVLTGEGADEFLAGYDVFKEDQVRRFWARAPESTWRSALLARVHAHVGPNQPRSGVWLEFFRRGLTEVNDPFYAHRVRWLNTNWTLRFLDPSVRDAFTWAAFESEVTALLPAGWQAWPTLSRAQLVEIDTFLTPYLLSSQGDRVAMAHGVEVRYPFLDPQVIDFCCRLPSDHKLRGLHDKRILRRFARGRLPREIADRPKVPYRAPMTTAFFGEAEPDYVEELLGGHALGRHGWIDAPVAELLLAKARRNAGVMGGEREEMAVIGLLTLQWLGYWYLDHFTERVAEARERLADCRPDVYRDMLT